MSQSLTNDTFPYTMTYVSNQLRVDEERVNTLCQRFGIQPHHDIASGTLFFSQQDVETLRKVIEAETRGETLSTQLAPSPAAAAIPSGFNTKSHYATPVTPRSNDVTTTRMSRTDLSLIVDSVSNAKAGILTELSQLLDEKLSGLDDVVVELIRSKSEADALREDLERAEREKRALQDDLAKFHPAAFGFWRKEG